MNQPPYTVADVQRAITAIEIVCQPGNLDQRAQQVVDDLRLAVQLLRAMRVS